jgi:hypothetical protein
MINFLDRFLDKIVHDAFPELPNSKPIKFVFGRRGLGPLRTELLGLKRNHARDEIQLDFMHQQWSMTLLPYYFDTARRRPPDAISRIEHKQRIRVKRMGEIEAKLKRDGRMGKCQ